MKINVEQFKTLHEQIDILNRWGNNFLDKNSKEKEKVLEYLQDNNFQTGVDAFAPLLWKNLDDGIKRKNYKFIDNFKFKDLTNLYDFDSCLKNKINELLQRLEKRLRNGIIYYTLTAIKEISNSNINLPFLLVDDEWSQIIGKSIFCNNLSKQSFLTNDIEFKFNEYYSFLQKYIEPFETSSLFVKNVQINKFYFGTIFKNYEMLKTENNFNQYKSFTKMNIDNLIPLEITDSNNNKIMCTYQHFFKWCRKNKKFPNELKDDEQYLDLSTTDGMMNVLAKSFVPMYKSFTQDAFGDTIKFFSKLSHTIQIKVIKEWFQNFYQKISAIINDKDNFDLILIGTFISFLEVFKNIRNRIAHLDIIYNFWDIHVLNNSSLSRTVKIKENDFWITNKPTCMFLNTLTNKENIYFQSEYFKKQYFGKDSNYYLDRINSLGIKAYCKYKNNDIYYAHQGDNKIWSLPLFFLNDAIDWLLVFINKPKNFSNIVQECFLKINFENNEIKNRLHDYLLNKIIISFEKIDYDLLNKEK